MKVKAEAATEVMIEKMYVGKSTVWVKGITPMISNCMSAKVKRQLLLPAPKKTSADKAQNLKHNPIQEYRDSVYRDDSKSGATRIAFPCGAIKESIACAALEIPGAKKSQIERLVWVEGEVAGVYGVPQLFMRVVRSADMNRTPDLRTRAIIKDWCAQVTIRYVMPTLNETSVSRLLETAGLIIGWGDFRQQKGAGNYGQFEICDAEDVAHIVKSGGRSKQDDALESPEYYDTETTEMMTWYQGEMARRGR